MRHLESPLAETVPVEHLQHRAAFWDFVRDQAEPKYRDALTRLLGVWEDANVRYYGGVLAAPIILLATPVTPTTYGDCSAVSGWGARSQIRIRPSLLDGTHPHVRAGGDYAEGRFRFVADVLVHEQIHQWQQEVTRKGEGSYHGHGPTFCEQCNAIGTALGLDMVIVRTRKGTAPGAPRCPQWPHNVRPTAYYLGAYRRSNGNASGDICQRDVTCGCGRTLPAKVIESGPILCGLCGQPFAANKTEAPA